MTNTSVSPTTCRVPELSLGKIASLTWVRCRNDLMSRLTGCGGRLRDVAPSPSELRGEWEWEQLRLRTWDDRAWQSHVKDAWYFVWILACLDRSRLPGVSGLRSFLFVTLCLTISRLINHHLRSHHPQPWYAVCVWHQGNNHSWARKCFILWSRVQFPLQFDYQTCSCFCSLNIIVEHCYF